MIEDTGPDILCPACESQQVRTSGRRKWLDWALAPVLYAPMRCRICRHRFYYSRAFGRALGSQTRIASPQSHSGRSFEQWKHKKGAQFALLAALVAFVTAAVYTFFHFISRVPAF